MPEGSALGLKGVAVALADGIGSSRVSGVAASLAVRAVVEDYYCTPESWTVKLSAGRVIEAVNGWLHAETRRVTGDPDRGYVCTLDALILRGAEAHVFHVGDGRIARRAGRTLEALTEPHRMRASSVESYLARALGAGPHVEIDYRAVPLAAGDLFVLTTDGVHDHLASEAIVAAVDESSDLEAAARLVVARAAAAGSRDDRTVQLVRVDAVAPGGPGEGASALAALAPPGALAPGAVLDGMRILRTLHDSARSHLYLAETADGGRCAIKVLATELAEDASARRRFAMEEWVGRRVRSPHVVTLLPAPGRSSLYVVMEAIEGQTLAQWMRDHASPPLERVRELVEQVARGLDALHRRQMTHGDLRPENVMVDAGGRAVIVDLGSVRVAGLAEADATMPLGTALYSAPEVLLGAAADERADVFSLAAIAFQALSGRLPYGSRPARLRAARDLRRLRWRGVREARRDVPAWVDAALRRGLSPDPAERTQTAAAFAHALRQPSGDPVRVPWAARDPVRFWQGVALLLAAALLGVAAAWVAPK